MKPQEPSTEPTHSTPRHLANGEQLEREAAWPRHIKGKRIASTNQISSHHNQKGLPRDTGERSEKIKTIDDPNNSHQAIACQWLR
jgi:hypothetical protein